MENTSPHSALARSKTVRVTRTGREIKPSAPTPHETTILRRIARGALLVTIIDGKERYCYEDGTLIAAGGRKHEFFTDRQLDRFVRQHWIVPDPSAPALMGERAQRYVVPPLR